MPYSTIIAPTAHGMDTRIPRMLSACPGTRLLYKYSLARKVVVEAQADMLLIFADESAVMYEPLAADRVIGDSPYWIAQCAVHYMGYPDRFRAVVMRSDAFDIDRRNRG